MISAHLKLRALEIPSELAEQMEGLPSKPGRDGTCLVPWADTVVEWLQLHGHEAPAPMEHMYRWKGYKPFPHQVEICNFASTHRRCFVFGDIGVGKTWCIASLCDWLMQPNRPLKDRIRRPLILVPKSTKLDVWGRELFSNFSHHHYITPATTGAAPKIRNHGDGFLIMNHDAIRSQPVLDAILAWAPDMVVVDESTVFKTWNSQRTKAIRKIVKQCQPERVVYATGTPMPQSPMDMYGQAKMICPESIPRTKQAFQEQTMEKLYEAQNFAKWVPRPDAAEKIFKWVAPHAIRINIEDTDIDLPDCKHLLSSIEQTPQQTQYMEALRREAYAIADCGGIVQAANEAGVMLKILQLSGGSAYGEKLDGYDDQGYVLVDATPKYNALDRFIGMAEGPVIVFATFRSHVDMVTAHLKGKGYRVEFVDGRITSDKKRSQIFRRFQGGEVDVLVANPAAMAHGITLTASNMVVWWSLPMKAEVYLQANGRIRRISQGRIQYYIHLICTDLEREVLSKLKRGIALQDTLLKMIKDGSL